MTPQEIIDAGPTDPRFYKIDVVVTSPGTLIMLSSWSDAKPAGRWQKRMLDFYHRKLTQLMAQCLEDPEGELFEFLRNLPAAIEIWLNGERVPRNL